jgi:hypothetical protein
MTSSNIYTEIANLLDGGKTALEIYATLITKGYRTPSGVYYKLAFVKQAIEIIKNIPKFK